MVEFAYVFPISDCLSIENSFYFQSLYKLTRSYKSSTQINKYTNN